MISRKLKPAASLTETDDPSTRDLIAHARETLTRLSAALNSVEDRKAGIGKKGASIASWRSKRGMTQQELARLVGVTPAAICYIERSSKLRGRPATRAKIAFALGVPLDWIII